MERLTERSKKTSHENGICCTHFRSKECNEVYGNCAFGCKWEEEAWEKLCEYEDLEEQGLLLKLPCKVGDTVYVDIKTIPFTNIYFEGVEEVPLYLKANVVSFRQNCNGNYIKLKVKAKWLNKWIDRETGPDSVNFETKKNFTYPLSSIGKTVFLTQAEAEQKLKEMEV